MDNKNSQDSLPSINAGVSLSPKPMTIQERIKKHNLVPALVLYGVGLYGAWLQQLIIVIICSLLVIYIIWIKSEIGE